MALELLDSSRLIRVSVEEENTFPKDVGSVELLQLEL